MLSAQKKLLEASVAEQGAQLQSSELTYFSQNFGTMMTMSSVIGGFAFSGILIPTTYNEDGMWKDNINWIVDIYYSFAAISVGSCMAAAIICMSINVRGPGLALRGPDGSLKRAVEGMRKWQRRCIWCLACGVVCVHRRPGTPFDGAARRCPTGRFERFSRNPGTPPGVWTQAFTSRA